MATKSFREAKSAENSWDSISVFCTPPFVWLVGMVCVFGFSLVVQYLSSFLSWKEATAEMGIFFLFFFQSLVVRRYSFLLGPSYKVLDQLTDPSSWAQLCCTSWPYRLSWFQLACEQHHCTSAISNGWIKLLSSALLHACVFIALLDFMSACTVKTGQRKCALCVSSSAVS